MFDVRPILFEVEVGAVVAVVTGQAEVLLGVGLGDTHRLLKLLLKLQIAARFSLGVRLAGAVARFAADALIDMDAVIEIDEARLSAASSSASNRR